MISITASFDDGSIFDLRTADLMQRYNIQTTFYIPVNWRKYLIQKGIEPLGEDDAHSIAKDFVIGSHGVDHHLLTKVDHNTIVHEVVESRKALQDMFGQPITKFCYPRGYYDDRVRQIVKDAGYSSARTVRVGFLGVPEDPLQTDTAVHVGYDRKEYKTDWLTYAETLLARAVEQSAYRPVRFHFWGHSEEINRNNQWERFEKFLKQVKPYV